MKNLNSKSATSVIAKDSTWESTENSAFETNLRRCEEETKIQKSEGEEGDVSTHMVARWYRPPEIILDQSYDQKVDVWSLGCVFAELAYVYEPEVKDTSKRFLFKGSSCYPHSPKEMEANQDGKDVNISSNDQLIKILETLGELSTSDLEYLDDASLVFVKNLKN